MIEQLPLMGKLYTRILDNIIRDFNTIHESIGSKPVYINCYDGRLTIHKFNATTALYEGKQSLVVEYYLQDGLEIHLVWPGKYLNEQEIQIMVRNKPYRQLFIPKFIPDHTPTMRKHIHEIFVKLQNVLKEHGIRTVTST